MAMGFSGSNGGVSKNIKKFSNPCLQNDCYPKGYEDSLEVSYFINNICNLKCRHCYVGYKEINDSLTEKEWENTFNVLISSGARTFGNVGKEPLLDWEKTKHILNYFKTKKRTHSDLRYGFVTNGTLLDDAKANELNDIMPDYIDISLDGNKELHDFIRGKGTFDALTKNLRKLSHHSLKEKIFISFTLNRLNLKCAKKVIKIIYNLGIKNILISPYVSLSQKDMLYISDNKIIEAIQDLLAGDLINFRNYSGLNIYIKNDFATTKSLMEKMINIGIIDLNNLLIDDYGVIFNEYEFNNNLVYFNYMPFDSSLKTAIRISHNGYVSNCLDMFYEDYPERAIGNIRESDILDLLGRENMQRFSLANSLCYRAI